MINTASLLTTNGIIDVNNLPLNTYANLLPPPVTKDTPVNPASTSGQTTSALNIGF